MIPKQVVALALAGLLLLPIAILLVVGAASLLTAMQDAAGAAVLQRIGLALGLVWLLGLIALILMLGVNALAPPGDRPEHREEDQ
ncbi:MAG TPA: hypothetical protein VFW87_24910 [Pirellulales bacterium]|nr:hypothetical protein [Pirellulales bacterium]